MFLYDAAKNKEMYFITDYFFVLICQYRVCIESA